MRRTLIPNLAALVGLLIACGPMPKTITSDERARLGWGRSSRSPQRGHSMI